MKHIINFIVLLIIIMKFGEVGDVRAQNVSLSFAPARHDIVAKPGTVIPLNYTLINKGDPIYITTGVLPFNPSASDGSIVLEEKDDGLLRFTSGSDEFPIGKTRFLKSGETIPLLIDMEVPKVIKESDYNYAVFVRTEAPPGTEGEVSVRLQQQILSPLYITVTQSASVSIKPSLSLFEVTPLQELPLFAGMRIANGDKPAPIHITVANNGSYAYSMDGSLTVNHLLGSHKLPIPQQRILASSTKPILISPVPASTYGRVTVNLTLNYGESGIKNYSRITYFAIPYRFLPYIPVILILIAGVVYYRRRGKRR